MTADALFRALCGNAPQQPVFIDIPAPNSHAKALVERYGMTSVFPTARMYRGHAPVLPLERIYGLTTLELG